MRKWLILTILVLFAAGQVWADCAWVLVEEKKSPDHLISAPAVSVSPYTYYETQKECLEGEKTRLDFEAIVQGRKVAKKNSCAEGRERMRGLLSLHVHFLKCARTIYAGRAIAHG